MSGQVVDTESAREFMKEALTRISPDEMDAIAAELADKSRRFKRLLSREMLGQLSEAEYRRLFRSIFSTRRSASRLLQANGVAQLSQRIAELLYGERAIEDRLQAFCESLEGVEQTTRFDLASELLHYTFPDQFWLWTRWMWNPRNQTGALRLVTMDGYDFGGRTTGETYLRVGEAVAFINETAKAAGFQRPQAGVFGTTVYLVLVYVIYIYTTLRMRMTQEFNQVVPDLPELSRRILGVYRLEV